MKIILGIILLGYMIFGAVKESPMEKNSQANSTPEMNIEKEDRAKREKVVYLDVDGKLIKD